MDIEGTEFKHSRLTILKRETTFFFHHICKISIMNFILKKDQIQPLNRVVLSFPLHLSYFYLILRFTSEFRSGSMASLNHVVLFYFCLGYSLTVLTTAEDNAFILHLQSFHSNHLLRVTPVLTRDMIQGVPINMGIQ